MKTNEIRIIIDAPANDIFEFVLEPKNTPTWIEGAGEETVNTDQIGLGTVYSNDIGKWVVTDYEKGKFFELSDTSIHYSCSYSFRKINEICTELVYFESHSDGSNLENPMEEKNFKKLKEILEK